MTDPQDYVFVDRLVRQPSRRTRRHLILADTDWRPASDGEMRATITINGVGHVLVEREALESEPYVHFISGRPYMIVRVEEGGRTESPRTF